MLRSILRCALVAACLAKNAIAHDGPPYPIFVDEPFDDWKVSIWTDPDVGTGTFYYYVEAPDGHSPTELVFHVSSRPLDGLSGASTGDSVPAEPDEPFQSIGELEFSHRGTWETRFELLLTDEGARRPLGTLDYELDVTPPGLGAVNLLWFALPFLAIGALWWRGLMAQRAHDRSEARASSPPS